MQGGIYQAALRCEHIGRLPAITKHCQHAHTAYRKEKAGEHLLRKGHLGAFPSTQVAVGSGNQPGHTPPGSPCTPLLTSLPPGRSGGTGTQQAPTPTGRRCDRRAAAGRVIVVQGWPGREGQTPHTSSPPSK